MATVAQRSRPAPELGAHLAKLQWLVEGWRDTGTFERFAHVRNLLSCFPELLPAFEDILDRHGFDRDVNALLDPLLCDALDPGTGAIARFGMRPLSVVANRELAEELVGGLLTPDEELAGGDALYLAASACVLRRKIADRPQAAGRVDPVRADDLHALRAAVAAGPPAQRARPAHPTVSGSVDSLRARKDAVTGMSRLKPGYAEYDPDRQVFSASLHMPDTPFVHGPYLQLDAGRYVLALELGVARPATLELAAQAFRSDSSRVLSVRMFDMAPGRSVLRMPFDWPDSVAPGHLFECQLRVVHPTMAAVELTGFHLRADTGGGDAQPFPGHMLKGENQ